MSPPAANAHLKARTRTRAGVKAAGVLVLALLALSAARGCAGQAQDDDWDASEFESAFIDGDDEPDTPPPPRQAQRQQQKVAPASTSQATNLDWDDSEFEGFPDDADTVVDGHAPLRRRQPSAQASSSNVRGKLGYIPEAIGGVLLLLYFVNYLLGSRANEALATAFAREFCVDGGFFPSQFSLVGVATDEDEDPSVLARESPCEYKFYASGRRFCEGLLATLSTKPRQDLGKVLWNSVASPNLTDTLEVEVYMNEPMEPMCMAVAPTKEAKRLHRTLKDLKAFASELSSAPDRVKSRFPTSLTIVSESAALADEIITDHLVEKVFGTKNGAWDAASPYFRSMHITDAHPDSSHARCLKFVFSMPAARDMRRLAPLLEMVTHCVDVVSRASLPQAEKAKAKARRVRQEELDLKEKRKEHEEALAKKREQKRADEIAKEEAMTPEARAKLEEARRRKELAKASRKGVKVVRR